MTQDKNPCPCQLSQLGDRSGLLELGRCLTLDLDDAHVFFRTFVGGKKRQKKKSQKLRYLHFPARFIFNHFFKASLKFLLLQLPFLLTHLHDNNDDPPRFFSFIFALKRFQISLLFFYLVVPACLLFFIHFLPIYLD